MARRQDPDDLPYGPGNPDYERDGLLADEEAARQQGEQQHDDQPQGDQQ